VQPLAEKFANDFMEMHPEVTVTIQGGGSSVGVKSADDGTVDIGAASRELKSSEPPLVKHILCRDGIAIVTEPGNTVSGLSKDQVMQIFAGEITSWSQVGGPSEDIIVVAREEGSGTRAAFEEMVMDESLITNMAILQPSNGAVRTTVATTPNSIGFLSFGYLDASVKVLAVDGVEATVANVLNESYTIARPLYFLTKEQPTGLVKEFIDYCLSVEAQAVVIEEGYISVAELSGTITEAGSTTVQPIAEKFANTFSAMFPNVTITIQGGGSSVGVKSADDGTVDIGAASRELKSSEPPLVKHLLCRDGIAIVTDPANTVSGLTTEQVRYIFAGGITNWSEVGGPNEDIIVVAREEGSGTRAAFEEMVMDESLITNMAILQPSNGAVRTTVATTPNSIGFLSFGYLDASVKSLAVDGVEGTVENAKSGDYPIIRPLYFLTKEEPMGIVKVFLSFCLSSAGQAIAEGEGYISVK
jgi:phosphate transport system substrate-binding protein